VVALRVLTPQSASPEQVLGEPLTTASDVYALGILLFELLADQPPYQIATGSPEEWARVVCRQPVPKPSSLVPAAAARAIRGDLDNITLKALEKERGRRYQSAADLAADLTCYLRGLPVQARPGGALYRARKFVARNRRTLAIAAVVLLTISVAVADAIREGQRANRRFQDVRQMANSFLFEFHDAIANLPGSTPARELVVTRALQYLAKLESEAGADIGLKRELAQSYLRIGAVQGTPYENNLGRPADARASFERAVALFQEVRRARPADMTALTDLAEARLRLSSLLENEGNKARSMQMNQDTAAMLEQAGQRQPLSAAAETALGLCYFGISESQMALEHAQEALQARLRSVSVLRDLTTRFPGYPDGQRWLAQTQKRLAYLYLIQLHDADKAADSLHNAIGIDEKRVARDPNNAVAKLDLALGQVYFAAELRRQGDLPGALALLNQGIAARSAVLSADPRNFRVRYLLITDYAKLGAWLREAHRTQDSHAAFQEGFHLAGEMDANTARLPDAVAAVAQLQQAER